MTPTRRTPQQRDRRFARVRRLTQVVLLSSGVLSAVLVGYVASAAKPLVKNHVTVPVTTAPSTTVTSTGSSSYTPPTAAPVTTTTVCTTTPSGTVTCY